MKRLILLLALFCGDCLTSTLILAQTPPFPMLKMPIWFEDAIGNKDTIWIGFDPSAYNPFSGPNTTNIEDTIFGEKIITEPFDSVFEVRASLQEFGVSTAPLTSKISVAWSQGVFGHPCTNSGRPAFFIHALHYPVTISWDDSYLWYQKSCFYQKTIFLTPTISLRLIESPQWWLYLNNFEGEGEHYYCMTSNNHIVDDGTIHSGDYSILSLFNVKGKGLVSLPGYNFQTAYGPPCKALATSESEANSIPVSIFPNPTSDILTVALEQSEKVKQVSWVDLTGKILRQYSKMDFKDQQLSISTHGAASGIYFLKIDYTDGSTKASKFIKMD